MLFSYRELVIDIRFIYHYYHFI